MTPEEKHTIETAVKQWLQEVVIDLELCPFAGYPFAQNTIRFSVNGATKEEQVIDALVEECRHLDAQPETETTLLICPHLFEGFYTYSLFLDWAEQTLKKHQWQGVYQIASFHPGYEFSGSDPDDIENYTNRSPYPILHLLREESLAKVLENYDSPEAIPERNRMTMNKLTREEVKRIFYYLRVTKR